MTITIDMLERRIEEIYNNPHLSDETKENFVKQKKELIDRFKINTDNFLLHSRNYANIFINIK